MKRFSRFVLCAAASALFLIATAPGAFAQPILGPNLSTFAILGGAGVAINGTGSVITGSVGGCCEAIAVTGAIPTNFNISGGTVQEGGAVATLAQVELAAAMEALTGLGTGLVTPIAGGLLGGQTLAPGVYTSASTMNLTGVLNLNGGGNANALWVFLVGSAITTASSSVVNVTNTGSGAGIYWVLPTTEGSATLGSNSTFAGNVLANISITAGTNVAIGCGRLLTQTASVTLAGTDTIGIGCSSNGFSGGGALTPGGEGPGTITPLPFQPLPPQQVPEPGALLLLGTGIVGWVARERRSARQRRLTPKA